MGQITTHVSGRQFRVHSGRIPEPALDAARGRCTGTLPRLRVDSSREAAPLRCTAPWLPYNPGGHRVFDTQRLGHDAWQFA